MAATTSPKPRKRKVQREVKYPDRDVITFLEERGGELTAEKAKEFLGWEEETEEIKFGEDYLCKTRYGNKKVRCTNNTSNRPFEPGLAEAWMTEILKKHWRFNGEAMSIGKTEMIISGQHRLVALAWAVEEWENDPTGHWRKLWKTEPTIPALVVVGIDEVDEVINTVDTGKRRSVADAIYRSGMYADMPRADRQALGKLTEYAVRLLWARTGAKDDVFTPARTHAETFEFLERHPHIAKAVRHVYQEDQHKSISNYYPAGYAAAILYLMGCSLSDGQAYREDYPPKERRLNWDRWDKACEFWSQMSSPEGLRVVKDTLMRIKNQAPNNVQAPARLACLTRAWEKFAADEKMAARMIEPEYSPNEKGRYRMAADADITFGGIDVGPHKVEEDDEPVHPEDAGGEETPEGEEGTIPVGMDVTETERQGIEERMSEVRREKESRMPPRGDLR